jgi:DNA-directed RNA polymerase I, II, and III subunit RPABC2
VKRRERRERKEEEMAAGWRLIPPCARSDEPVLEEDEITEFYEPEVPEDEDAEHLNGDDQDNVVISGDPSAAANASKDKSVKNKKIPDDQRTTTPYMTKYERARILGTRALQIRWAIDGLGQEREGSSMRIC